MSTRSKSFLLKFDLAHSVLECDLQPDGTLVALQKWKDGASIDVVQTPSGVTYGYAVTTGQKYSMELRQGADGIPHATKPRDIQEATAVLAVSVLENVNNVKDRCNAKIPVGMHKFNATPAP